MELNKLYYTVESIQKQTEKQATKRAKDLCAYLSRELGGDWEPLVWESLGWRYQATLGDIQVHFNEHSQTFSNLISGEKDKPYSGLGNWNHNSKHIDPAKSVIKSIKIVRGVISRLVESLNHDIDLLNKREILEKI